MKKTVLTLFVAVLVLGTITPIVTIMKKRALVAILFIILIVSLAACADPELNNEAKQAYEQVLDQYRKVAEMSYEEYQDRKDEFPLVCEQAMSDYHIMGHLFYGYYDLNGDGLDELLIGSDVEQEEMQMDETDIIVYHDSKVFSVLPDDFRRVDKTVDVAGLPTTAICGPGVYKKNMIFVKTYSGPYKRYPDDPSSSFTFHDSQIYYFRLNKEGDSLEVTKYQCAHDEYFQEYKMGVFGVTNYDTIVYGELENGFKNIPPDEYVRYPVWEYYGETEIPYEVLIEKAKE